MCEMSVGRWDQNADISLSSSLHFDPSVVFEGQEQGRVLEAVLGPELAVVFDRVVGDVKAVRDEPLRLVFADCLVHEGNSRLRVREILQILADF